MTKPEALVERPAHVGGEEQDGAGAALVQARDGGLGERAAEAVPARLGGDAQRADPAGRPERDAADRAGGRAVAVLGDEDVAVRARAREGDEPRDGRPEGGTRQQVGDRAGLLVTCIAHRGHHGPHKR